MGQQIPVLLTTWVFRFTSICVHDLRINDTAIFSLFLIRNYYTFEQGSNIEITKNSPKSSLDPLFTKHKTLCSAAFLKF